MNAAHLGLQSRLRRNCQIIQAIPRQPRRDSEWAVHLSIVACLSLLEIAPSLAASRGSFAQNEAPKILAPRFISEPGRKAAVPIDKTTYRPGLVEPPRSEAEREDPAPVIPPEKWAISTRLGWNYLSQSARHDFQSVLIPSEAQDVRRSNSSPLTGELVLSIRPPSSIFSVDLDLIGSRGEATAINTAGPLPQAKFDITDLRARVRPRIHFAGVNSANDFAIGGTIGLRKTTYAVIALGATEADARIAGEDRMLVPVLGGLHYRYRPTGSWALQVGAEGGTSLASTGSRARNVVLVQGEFSAIRFFRAASGGIKNGLGLGARFGIERADWTGDPDGTAYAADHMQAEDLRLSLFWQHDL